jgi:sec-independent protein translocase protein TatA
MFGPLGFPEVLFILVLALLIFGPRRLPEIGRTIGKGMAQFRKASNDLRRSIESEISLDEDGPPRRPASFAPPRTSPSRHIEPAAALPQAAAAPSEPKQEPAEPKPAAEPEPPAEPRAEPQTGSG